MPNTKSAKKRMRQDEKRKLRNRMKASAMKTAIRRVQTLAGVPVWGGQLSFAFVDDQLTLIRNQALPRPTIAPRSAEAAPATETPWLWRLRGVRLGPPGAPRLTLPALDLPRGEVSAVLAERDQHVTPSTLCRIESGKVNPRASRTVPFVAKATDNNVITLIALNLVVAARGKISRGNRVAA